MVKKRYPIGVDDYRVHQNRYPVIYLTLKDWKPATWDHGFDRIKSDIARLYTKHDYLLVSDVITVAD